MNSITPGQMALAEEIIEQIKDSPLVMAFIKDGMAPSEAARAAYLAADSLWTKRENKGLDNVVASTIFQRALAIHA